MRQILILIIFLLINTNTLADKKFEKDLKKVSKDNGFIDNTEKIYTIDNISDKKNTILIVYTHGSGNDQQIDKCN